MENKKVIHKVFCVVILLTIFIFVSPAKVSADENTSFNVNVQESLSVSITTPTTWASGNINTFLRNKVSISVSSNNSAGFTASMTAKTMDTSLTNTSRSSYSIPTLDSSSVTRISFPANYWGYSLDDDDSNNGSGSSFSTYRAMVGSTSTPITILSSNVAATSSKDFYFGAKADVSQASGTYVGTVVISVVSGVTNNNSNPITPVDPVTPGEDQVAIYDSSANRTYYTYSTTSSGTSTTTTQISSGDNRSAYVSYTPPQGATHNKLDTNATLVTGLGIATAVAATSGFFFLAAVRREEE